MHPESRIMYRDPDRDDRLSEIARTTITETVQEIEKDLSGALMLTWITWTSIVSESRIYLSRAMKRGWSLVNGSLNSMVTKRLERRLMAQSFSDS